MRRSLSFCTSAAAGLMLLASTACAEPSPLFRQVQAISGPRLGPDQLAAFDCKAEVTLVGLYWDRMGNKLRLDPSVYRRAIQAYQSGDTQACYVAVQETRRYLGF